MYSKGMATATNKNTKTTKISTILKNSGESGNFGFGAGGGSTLKAGKDRPKPSAMACERNTLTTGMPLGWAPLRVMATFSAACTLECVRVQHGS